MLNRICTYTRGGCIRGSSTTPPRAPSGPQTHVRQRQPQPVAQDPPQVPDLGPHGTSHVLLLQGAERLRWVRMPPAPWAQRRGSISPLPPCRGPQRGLGDQPGDCGAADPCSPAARPCSCPCWSCRGRRMGRCQLCVPSLGTAPPTWSQEWVGDTRLAVETQLLIPLELPKLPLSGSPVRAPTLAPTTTGSQQAAPEG